MGKAMAKSDVIFGEDKTVELRSFHSQRAELESIIIDSIGMEHRHDINTSGLNSTQAAAERDSAMHDAHVKVGVIDGDLIWRAKAKKFTGEKEYDVILVRHYAKYVRDQEDFVKGLFSESVDAGGHGVHSQATATHGAPGSAVDEFQAILEHLKATPGYYPNLDSRKAEARLAGEPVGSWLVRASSQQDTVTWSCRQDNPKQPVRHRRIASQADYRDYTNHINGAGKGLQVTH